MKRKCFAGLLTAVVLTFGVFGAEGALADGSSIVNIGVTSTVGSLNPLLVVATEIDKYASGLQFLPLVELNQEGEFEPMLAESITTEDNQTFTVTLAEGAVWSDGEQVTAEDLAFTMTRLASPVIANTAMSFAVIDGTDDSGFVEEGAKTISGLNVVDGRTLEIRCKWPMSLITFQNSYARYIMTIPRHVLGELSEEELLNSTWFNAPDVVDGPYRAVSVDPSHYVSYAANENFFKGAPSIETLNLQIVEDAQLLSGLSSGEIDFVQPTMGAIPEEDQAQVAALEGVTAIYDKPITTQSLFINTRSVDNVKVRQAMLLAIDREMLLENLLGGKGEIDDGFITSASPYYDESLKAISADLEKAKALVEEAVSEGWDNKRELNWEIWAEDQTFVNAAPVIQSLLLEAGIQVRISTKDLDSLMADAEAHTIDLMTVQYTYPQIDPYLDVQWLISDDNPDDDYTSWTGYSSEAVDEALARIVLSEDVEEIKGEYRIIDEDMQKNVPMINVYVISGLGVVSDRLENAVPSVYGAFNNVEDWTLKG